MSHLHNPPSRSFLGSVSHELDLVLPTAAIISAALLLIENVNHPIINLAFLPMAIVGALKICMLNDGPRRPESSHSVTGRIVANGLSYLGLMYISQSIEDTKDANGPEWETLFIHLTEYCRLFYLLLVARGGFLLVDNFLFNRTLGDIILCVTSSDTKIPSSNAEL